MVESDFNAKATVDTAHAAGKKILVSIGGGYDQGIFGDITRSPFKQAKLVKDIAAFVVTHGYDGVDVDWE